MQDKLKAARDAGKLKPYDLTQAQVGDKIDLPFTTPCEVLAIHNGVVVLGQVEGTEIYDYAQGIHHKEHNLYHLPVAWLKDDPIYIGTVLYSTSQNGSWNVVRRDGRGVWVQYYHGDYEPWPTPLDEYQTMDDDGWTLTPKPRTITINGIDVPSPEVVAPAVGTRYWWPDLFGGVMSTYSTWYNDEQDKQALARGIVHLTEAAALKHAEALLSFTTKE